jgi:hypothetical protein
MDTTLTDLADDRNLVDAEHELTRAEETMRQGGGHALLLAWAVKWARPAVVALQELQELQDAEPINEPWGV